MNKFGNFEAEFIGKSEPPKQGLNDSRLAFCSRMGWVVPMYQFLMRPFSKILSDREEFSGAVLFPLRLTSRQTITLKRLNFWETISRIGRELVTGSE